MNNQSILPSIDVIQLTLTLKMTTAQSVETSVTVNNNSPIQDYVHPDDQTQPTFDSWVQTFHNEEYIDDKETLNLTFRTRKEAEIVRIKGIIHLLNVYF